MVHGWSLRFRERGVGVGAAGALAALMLAALLWLVRAGPAQAAGVVGNGDPGSCTQAALAGALAGGGLVTFNCGASPKTILLSSQQVITQDTTVDGGGMITLSGAGVTRVFTISTGVSVTMANLTIRDGAAGVAEAGGAIFSGGSLTIKDSSFISNTAATAGAILNFGPITLSGTTMLSNTATGSAGNAGALLVIGGSTQVSASTFTGNTAARWGGAVAVVGGPVSITAGSEFSANRVLSDTGRGGALYIQDSIGTLQNSLLTSNTAEGLADGGALHLDGGMLSVESTTFIGNTAERGGGINAANSVFTITRSSFLSNTVAAFGGGLNQSGGDLYLADSVVAHNTSAGNGGGLRFGASTGAVSIINTTIAANKAISEGGGLEQTTGSLLITNSTIVSNTAETMTGGNLLVNAITATNTIVAFGSPDNCSGLTLADGGGNLQFGGTVPNSCGATIATGDPLLGPLQNNGGSTLTYALLAGSPAIDAGSDAACPAADQRGAPRPADGNNNGVASCDIGAYEFAAAIVRVLLPIVIR